MDSRNNLSKPTSHPNELQLKLVDSYEGAQISLQEKEHFITDGQPYSGTSLSGYTITVEAGRKGSTEVAGWFNRQITGGSAINSLGHSSLPEKMNFAVSIVLTITKADHSTVLMEIVIAQSHTNGHNDWWIGSKDIIGNTYIQKASNGEDMAIAQISGLDTYTFEIGDSTNMWMSCISSDSKLLDLSIPGTHDSGTANVREVTAAWARCQNFGIATQLSDGIRFFDIRLNENLDVIHGPIDCNLSFDSIVTDLRNFLNMYQTESVLLCVKNESGDIGSNLINKIKEYESKYPGLFYRTNRIPTLGEVRGRIVLFRRFPLPSNEGNNWGINIYNSRPDNQSATFTNDAGDSFYVEDRYFEMSESTHDTVEKASEVKKAIEAAGEAQYKNNMFLIFNSVAATVNHSPWDYAWGEVGIDPIMNPKLSDILNNVAGNKRVGVILMDFYNKHGHDDKLLLSKRIIKHNKDF